MFSSGVSIGYVQTNCDQKMNKAKKNHQNSPCSFPTKKKKYNIEKKKKSDKMIKCVVDMISEIKVEVEKIRRVFRKAYIEFEELWRIKSLSSQLTR